MDLRHCPECGEQISEDALACPYCGTSLAERQEDEDVAQEPADHTHGHGAPGKPK